MNDKLLQPYNPAETEERIYKQWEESGYFNPDVCIADGVTEADAESFSIVLPPPNVTGQLHVGHAAMLAIEDIMVRFNRMQGKKTLWIPGTDHAAIATQSKVEKELAKKKLRRHDLGREKFLEHVNEFAMESQSTILRQSKRMGASMDWSRLAFTLDETRERAVQTAFKRMYDDGLVYRGERIVNWDPKGQTVISDDEIVRVEETSKFYYFKYGPFTIGTARPETKFADKYIIVHPDDARYAEYQHMQEFDVEWINGPIKATLLKDEVADPEMGTGAMTITPWHSQVDFELAQKYDLPMEQIIDQYGKLLPISEEFASMKITDAREKIVEKLAKKGLVEKIDEGYFHQLATAERTGGIIEPQIMKQWFIDTEKEFEFKSDAIEGLSKGQKISLKEAMLHVVRNKSINILPERFEKVYFNWIENLRPWNISRQIWYGHQIPVWYDKDGEIHLPRERKVYFVRHGESQANADKIYAGQLDSPLTDTGREQAKQAAQNFIGKNFDHILVSPLSRAKETCEIIIKEAGLSSTADIWDALAENNIGSASGKPYDGEKTLLDAGLEAGDGDSLRTLEARAHDLVARLKELSGKGDILVVGHGNFTRIVMAVLQGKTGEGLQEFVRSFRIPNAGYIEHTMMQEPENAHELTRDSDTLDTWFSSGLWTFSTLGWPDNTPDMQNFHPTSVLETGYDIIFFWVARMILMSTYLLGDIPFKAVYLHGLVRDEKGRKISKSLGNNIDPIELIEKYGADALRMALIIGTAPGQDSKLGEDKTKAYKKFANKLWNVARFILENTEAEDATPQSRKLDSSPLSGEQKLAPADQELLIEQTNLLKEITKEMNEYKFYIVGEKLYHYVWHELADKIIEDSKDIMASENQEESNSRKHFLRLTLKNILKALHPFMPYVTEEIWSFLGEEKQESSKPLMVQKWPV